MGSKGKVRSGPRMKSNKHKRWKKGHSSSSNPETTRFREAAKNRFFSQKAGSSSLTMDALAKHDEAQSDLGDKEMTGSESDRQTAGGSTFNTWATNWTECTNATFNKVHRYWASNSALHREILAVLAAVTEVIKTQGGVESETEYFAALMTALETSDGVESLAAIVYLVSLVIKRVPVPVLRSRFSEVAKRLMEILSKHGDTYSTSLIKSTLFSLAFLLRSQEHAVWNNSSTQQVFKALLTFTTHKKPKVRKAAHQGVCIVLKGSLFMVQGDPPPHHPAASITAKYCIQQIEACGGTGEATDTLHTLSLLKDTLAVMPQNSVKSVCETILRVMTLSNVMVTACCMQALHGLFAAKPKSTCLSTELNAQLMTALYDYQPSENDVQPMQAWLVVMETAHTNLSRLDEKLAISHLPRMFSTGMTCLLTDKTDVAQAATKMMKVLLQQCLASAAEGVKALVSSAPEGAATPVHKVVKALESGLGFQFHAAWGLVLQLMATVFEAIGKQCPQLFKKSLTAIADLRDSVRFPYKAELDHAVGKAVKHMGPRFVLQAVPLQITGQSDDLDFPRSWLLPVMRDNVMETELSFFTAYFLPLAARLRQRSLELGKEFNMVASKSYEALQLQIWSLLPGFCIRPTDLAQAFPGIAKVLGSAISDRPDLRMEVMASLRKLITQSLDNETSKAEVGRFAKNFLPILFNIYTTEPEAEKDMSRLAVLETIKCYFRITEKQLAETFCDKCIEKMGESFVATFKTYALHDVASSMIPYVNLPRLRKLYDQAVANLESTDKKLQKKSYRILEELCACKSKDSRDFVTSHLTEIQQTLLSSLASSSPSSKTPRLHCLISIFQQLDNEQENFLMAVIPEAILCTKEMAERARQAAFNLLVEMGNAKIRWSQSDTAAGLQSYFRLVMAGLAGSPQMISTTLLALTRILYQFKDLITGSLLDTIVDNVCLLLKSKAREVVQSALSFIKVLLSAYPDTRLAAHLKQLMSSLTSMKEESRHHFRFKSKEIYGKLIRKFGYETIYGMAPESIRKVLVNIRKTTERQKKKKQSAEQEEGEGAEEEKHLTVLPESIDELLPDSDTESESEKKGKKKGTKQKKQPAEKKGQAWLKEGDTEDIMDFMDPQASKKVLATKPEEKKTTKPAQSGFKMAPDGRIIITDDSEDDGGSMSGEDELDDLLEALEGGGKNTGKIKQKKRKLEDLGSDDEDASPAKYRAGGHGIHRPLGKGQGQKSKQPTFGAEYKAKKAKGDVKKKGKPDPFAYVPLSFQKLNKRKKAKMTGQFGNLVKGAKKGAAKGSKAKKKRK